MKLKDYWRLAKISLKSRKKSTRNTVAGIAFSLIIITPLIFAMVGLNISIMSQLNARPEMLTATFLSSGEGEVFEESKPVNYVSENGWYYGNGSSVYGNAKSDHNKYFEDKDTINFLIGNKNKNTTYYIGEHIDTKYYERIEIGDEKHYLHMEKTTQDYNPDMVQVSGSSSLAVLKDSDYTKFNNLLSNYWVDGCSASFSGDGATEVILSEKYLKMANLTPQDVYGKRISVFFEDYGDKIIDIDGTPTPSFSVNHYLFRDFKVVGVIKENDFYSNDIRGASIIVTGASYYMENGKTLAPTVIVDLEESQDGSYTSNNSKFNIGDYKEKNKITNKYIFPGGEYYNPTVMIEKRDGNNITDCRGIELNIHFYVASSYNDLHKTILNTFNEYRNLYENSTDFANNVGSSAYTGFQMLNKIFTIAFLVVSVFGGVILFAALINLFNSVKHSVDSRKNYLGVMKAIGARNSTIPKLYFFEVLRIFTRAFIWILVIGGAICVGIKLLIDMSFRGSSLGVMITIGWEVIPLVMGILALALVVIGVVYSLGCTLTMSKRPIMSLLEG